MSEHISGDSSMLASGGHRWVWQALQVPTKRLGATGTAGDVSVRLRIGARRGVIVGVLKGRGDSVAEANAELNQIEQDLEDLQALGSDYPAEDDCGHVIDALTIDGLVRTGPRQYGRAGGQHVAMQRYRLQVTNLAGDWGSI